MKRLLKLLGKFLLVVLVVILMAVAFIALRGIPTYKAEVPDVPKVESTPMRVERGAKIADMLCRSCHYNNETQKFTGRFMNEVPDFGKIYSRNITNDKEVGIGAWTDAQLIYFIRTGINPVTGKYSPPYMPKLMHISDEDLRSIVAFLRSDNNLVKPDKTELPETEPSFLTKFLCAVVFKPYPYPAHEIPEPDTTNQLAWGKYITLYQLECFACHSADFKKMDVATPENSAGFFGGGNKMLNNEGKEITTLNITPDEETGIGKWTEEQFVTALRTGVVPNGPPLRNPMLPYLQLTEQEAKAVYAYLRTVPKLNHKIDRGI